MVNFEPLKIALDYDETFNADKPMWANIVKFMKHNGCDVRFVTFRHEHPSTFSNEDILQDSDRLNIPIIFCEGVQKRTVCDSVMFKPDIWIDDSPEFILSENDYIQGLNRIAKGDRTPVPPFSQQSNDLSSKYSEETLVIPR